MNAYPVSASQGYRSQILERRARLEASSAALPRAYFDDLLAEIDDALARIDRGVFGFCETCNDPIEPDRLQANPLTRYCLDHLTRSEQKAHEQDLELAAQIQTRLLPQVCGANGVWDAHYAYEPAGPVGGDYCELIAEEGGGVFFAVGDVSGKGVAASLLMTHLSAILRSLLTLRLPLPELMSRANRLFCESTLPAHYATLVCGRASGDCVQLCNAAHCPPILLNGGRVERLEVGGLPLGLFFAVEYEMRTAPLEKGGAILLYSDGITEAQSLEGADFGEEGLIASARRHAGGDASALARGVMTDVSAFLGGARPGDDRTVFAIRRAS